MSARVAKAYRSSMIDNKLRSSIFLSKNEEEGEKKVPKGFEKFFGNKKKESSKGKEEKASQDK